MGRNRDSGKGLPPNLYQKNQYGQIYFQYRDPRTGKFHGLGYDRSLAINQAQQLNALIAAQLSNQRVQTIYQQTTTTPKQIKTLQWQAALDIYADIIEKRVTRTDKNKISPNTYRTRKSHINALRQLPDWELYSTPLDDMIADVVELLETYREEGKERTAQSLRSCLIDVFKELRQLGKWLHALDPASATKNQSVSVKRERLQLEQLMLMLEYIRDPKNGIDPWLEHVILLAVTTSHCNSELSQLTYTYVNNACFIEGDWLYITRDKVDDSRIKIPLDFGLKVIGYSIRDILAMTRADGLKTNHVIHHQTSNRVRAGEPVHPNTYSRKFAEVRDAVGIVPRPGKEPTTFYELRSLCKRLAKEQGVDTKTLMGHKRTETNDMYEDPRGGFIELKDF